MASIVKTNVPHNTNITVKEKVSDILISLEDKSPFINLTKITTISDNVIESSIIFKKLSVLMVVEKHEDS